MSYTKKKYKKWTDEDIAILISHLKKGASLYLLEMALPKFTRNAIAGKIKRLGFSCNGTSNQLGKLALTNISVKEDIAIREAAKEKGLEIHEFLGQLVRIGWKNYEANKS